MNKSERHTQFTHSLILLITAIIWGTSFVAQSAGMQLVAPVIYNCIRMFLGGLILIPIILIRNKMLNKQGKAIDNTRISIKYGIAAGVILCIASNLQNVAMINTSAGKAGFMTAFYIVLVPVVGIFVKKKTTILTWFSVFIALVGLYFLCIGRDNDFVFEPSDILLIGCALFFSFHILYVDTVSKKIDGLTLSCTQFLISGLISIPFIFIVDVLILHMPVSMEAISAAWWPIAYSGFMSCGVAYTLQVIGQKGVNPTLASLIMSLESVVSAISGLIILNQRLTYDETLGCIIMFTAVILAQLPTKSKSDISG